MLPDSATDLELVRLVDDGLDAKDASLLVVHLDAVGAHPVVDPMASCALPAAIEHLGLEIASCTSFDANGRTTFSAPVPPHPGLIGLSLARQALTLAPPRLGNLEVTTLDAR